MMHAADMHQGLGIVAPEDEPGLLERVSSSAEDAAAYLRARWSDFLNASPRLIDLQHRAAMFAAEANQRGDVEAAEEAKAIIRSVGRLNQVHNTLVDRMQQVADVVGVGGMLGGYTGLGAIPFAQVAAVTALAAGVVWFFRAAELEERKLELLREGVDPADIAMMSPGPAPVVAGLGNLAKWVVLGIAVWAGFRLLEQSGALRRFGRNPPLVVFDTNPPGGVIGEQTLAVWYQHADDGNLYVHEFGPGVQLVALEDGRVCLEHEDLPLWDEFEV